MNKSKLKKKYKKFREAVTLSIVNHTKYNVALENGIADIMRLLKSEDLSDTAKYSIKISLDELLKSSQSNLDLIRDKLKIKRIKKC